MKLTTTNPVLVLGLLGLTTLISATPAPVARLKWPEEGGQTKHLRPMLEARAEERLQKRQGGPGGAGGSAGFAKGQPDDGKGKGAPFGGQSLPYNLRSPMYTLFPHYPPSLLHWGWGFK